MSKDLNEILRHFQLEQSIERYGNGHINDTYLVQAKHRYILQRINPIFNPEQVMSNIALVTEHLSAKILANGGDPMRETLNVIPALDGKPYYIDEDGSAYRVYYFIENACSLDKAETPEIFAASAHAFGKFQRMLSDFPAEKLYEVIPKFHNTADRLRQFKDALANDA